MRLRRSDTADIWRDSVIGWGNAIIFLVADEEIRARCSRHKRERVLQVCVRFLPDSVDVRPWRRWCGS